MAKIDDLDDIDGIQDTEDYSTVSDVTLIPRKGENTSLKLHDRIFLKNLVDTGMNLAEAWARTYPEDRALPSRARSDRASGKLRAIQTRASFSDWLRANGIDDHYIITHAIRLLNVKRPAINSKTGEVIWYEDGSTQVKALGLLMGSKFREDMRSVDNNRDVAPIRVAFQAVGDLDPSQDNLEVSQPVKRTEEI